MAQQQTWATVGSVPPNCPPGLEYLVQVDQLNIQQETSLLEMFSGIEVANTYKVEFSLLQVIIFNLKAYFRALL